MDAGQGHDENEDAILEMMGVADERGGWKARLLRGRGSEAYFDWLVHVGSLTERLRRRCPDFRVTLVRQELARPGRDERTELRLGHHELAWVRDVLLRCNGRPVVFGHTVLPRRGVRGAWHLVAGLGTRPLGAILFTDPKISRMPFAFSRLDARTALYHRVAAAAYGSCGRAPRELWARRSVFCRGGKPILLTEVFLPEILALHP